MNEIVPNIDGIAIVRTTRLCTYDIPHLILTYSAYLERGQVLTETLPSWFPK